MSGLKKGSRIPIAARRLLVQLSKAALMDLVYDLAGVCSESADDEVGVCKTIVEYADIACDVRGDRRIKR